jgi:hypothetical protein
MDITMRYTVIKTNGNSIEHYHTDGSNDRGKAWKEAIDRLPSDSDWHVVAIVTGQHEVYSSEDFQNDS